MNKSLFLYITDFLAVLAIVVNSIQFMLFSLVGIEYDPESGSGLVAIVNVACCLYTMAWVFLMETTGPKPIRNERWPYFLPVWIIIAFFIESLVFDGVSLNTFSGTQLTFFGVFSVPAIYLATYIYRHDRFDMITRNADIIMLICTLSLGLYLPILMSGRGLLLAGGGNHQDVSYIAAFCFAINWTNIVTGNTIDRFPIFQKKICRYLFFILLPLQAMVCVLGGGRGGGVLLILSFVAILFVFSRQHKGRTMFWGILAVAVIAIVAIQSGKFSDGFGRTFNYLEGGKLSLENDLSDMERTDLRIRSYQLIGDSPIIGYGLWNGLSVAGYYMHNIFLDILISGGFAYLLIFFFLMKKIYKSAINMIKFDESKVMLLPWILYPSTILLFSGFYMSSSYFWFFCIYCFLNRNNIYSK